MRERPIIFNAEMVRAVLNGSKTQTRRIIKNQRIGDEWSVKPAQNPRSPRHTHDWWLPGGTQPYSAIPANPFGAVGDQLYVRETWAVVTHEFDDDGLMVDYVPDRPSKVVHEKPFGRGYYSGHTIYAADGSFMWGDDDGCVDGRSCWKPSSVMPRWASRITLEITGVRVERLQDLCEEDAKAEGLAEITKDGSLFKFGIPDRDSYPGTDDNGWSWHEWERNPGDAYSKLWQSIYGAESWQANPWVWVVEFRRIKEN